MSIAGAVLISSAGFALMLVLIADLPRLIVAPNGCLTPMFAALLHKFNPTIMQVIIPMMPLLMVIPITLAARRRRAPSARVLSNN